MIKYLFQIPHISVHGGFAKDTSLHLASIIAKTAIFLNGKGNQFR